MKAFKLFSILFLLTNFSYGFCVLSYDIATCSNTSDFKNHTVFRDTVLYFRSPDFPKTMPSPVICNAQFQVHENDSQLWLIMYNGFLSEVFISGNNGNQYYNGSYDSNKDYLSLVSKSNIIQFQAYGTGNWNAHEAVILSFSSTTYNMCPFGNQIINLEENNIIPITTNLGTRPGYSNCTWVFKIESNQILKLTIKRAISYDRFNIYTDGNMITFFDKSVSPDSPEIHHFNSSESGVFQINFISTLRSVDMLSFVSVIKNVTNYSQKQCSTEGDYYSYTIHNLDYDNGYTAYDQCTYNFIIPDNYELLLYPQNFYIENNADKIYLVENSSNLNLNPLIINPNFTYYLTSAANNAILTFQSDGNIQQAGFRFQATLLGCIECDCAIPDIVIPCRGDSFNYTVITPSPSSDRYCSNLQCSFNLTLNPLCPNNYYAITGTDIALHQGDYIFIYVNNQRNESITTSFSQRKYRPNDNVSLSFYSRKKNDSIYYDKFFGYWTIIANLVPKFVSIVNLTNTSPTHVLWLANLNENDAYTVCMNGNDSLELFIPYTYLTTSLNKLSSYSLFDSNNMGKFIATLDSTTITSENVIIPRHITSSSGCFTIYQSDSNTINFPVFFRMHKEDTKNCLSNNVFNTKRGYETYSLSLNATTNGECKMTILADYSQSIALKSFSISANASYSIISAINQKEYFELNSNNIGKWGPIKIYSPALYIIIPPSKSIKLDSASYDDSYEYVDGNMEESDGILTSPSYGGIKLCQNQIYALYTLAVPYQNNIFRAITLDVKYLDNNIRVVFENKDDKINITVGANSSIIQYGRQFSLYYNEKCPGLSNGFLIKYKIRQLNVTTTTNNGVTIPVTTPTTSKFITLTSATETSPTSPTSQASPTSPDVTESTSSKNPSTTTSTSGAFQTRYFTTLPIVLIIIPLIFNS